MAVTVKEIEFPVAFGDGTLNLKGTVFLPEGQGEKGGDLPPVVFNSGYTGGVSMYGQLFGRALAERGYRVMTYDVAGFFTNRTVRNTSRSGDDTVTNVSLRDQTDEVLAAIRWSEENFGATPAVASWAMGSVASLAAVREIAEKGGRQIPLWVPMSYTSIKGLQGLRADAAKADADIFALDDDAPIPPFDLGTEETRLGYYPLDPATQDYVDRQLGGYTEAGGVDRWPGCTHVTAKSYKEYVRFDPEDGLKSVKGLPPALIIHGAENTLHAPDESSRLHSVYPGQAGEAAIIVPKMQHGQQNQVEHPVFQSVIGRIDQALRADAAH